MAEDSNDPFLRQLAVALSVQSLAAYNRRLLNPLPETEISVPDDFVPVLGRKAVLTPAQQRLQAYNQAILDRPATPGVQPVPRPRSTPNVK